MKTPKIPMRKAAFERAEFTRYIVYYLSGGSPSNGVPQEVEIDCFDDKFNRKGIIYFFPESAELPANNININGIYLYFRLSRFADVMTILKEEKPLYLNLNTTNLVGYIGTGSEPVGEQEGI